SNDVWAVGENGLVGSSSSTTLIEHWDGTQWSIVPSQNAGTGINDLGGVAAVSANDIWAVGTTGPFGNYRTLIERWDGTQWVIIPGTPPGYLRGVSAISVNDVWAVGDSYDGGNFAHAIHWNGSTWSTVFVPAYSTSEAFRAVGGTSSTDVWAVGFD